jgi:hypothetical protein
MANPIFDNQPKAGNGSIFDFIRGIRNPKKMFDQMYESNPQFRDFANSMRGKTPEQAFKENGFDYDQFKGMMR